MKTKRWFILFILFNFFLSVGTLSSAAETLKQRRKVFKPGLQKPKRLKLSAKAERKSPLRFPGGSSLLSHINWSRTFHSSSMVAPSVGAGEPQADFAYVPDVSVTCSTTDFVVRVKPAFYGLGADAQELTLGSSCKSNGVLRPSGDLLFTYPLTECDGARELPPGYLVYKYVLHYEASPKRFPSRAQQLHVSIECHYERDHSVHQLAVQPTWQTVVLRKTLKGRPMDFQINFMDDSFTAHTKPQVYLLGQTVNIQVSAPHLPPGWKLYISSCYAAPSASKSSLKYTMIDNLGCMVDSKHEPGASQFVSRTDSTLKFSLRAFQFTADPKTEVSIHCKLSVTTEGPDPVHKSCTYKSHRWEALIGHDSICECCESTCASSKPQRVLLEGFASSVPMQVSDQPYTEEHDFQPVSSSTVSPGREDKNPNDLTDLNQKLWESLEKHGKNKEREQIKESEDDFGVTKEFDSHDLNNEEILEEFEANHLNILKTGSGYEGFSEHPEAKDTMKGSEDEIIEEKMIHESQKKEDLSQIEQMVPSEVVQAELEPPVSEERTDKTRACEGDKDRRGTPSKTHGRNVSSLMDGEKTWIFTWT
ncbi:zona pellucida sperm-binding protein 3 [Nematolebias whitei]|uniref:zona pellucida sperm-binding protein 3 n=1 Tax=Nematolebias whitei TaxID=451745 RepID=UPI00189AE64A|nr:zona pellucida sperm-binding protein 3 [Nematolebias whitei]